MVKTNTIIENINNKLLVLFSLCFPIDFHIATNILFLQVLLLLFRFKKDKIFLIFRSYYFFIFLFALYFLSMLLFNESFKDIENKLPYIIFPFVFSNFKIENFDLILKSFVIGCLISISICYFYPFLYYFNFNTFTFTPIYYEYKEIETIKYDWINYFISNHYTKTIMNRAYFSMYMSFAFYILLIKSYFNNKVKSIFLIILAFAIFQSYSVTGIIIFTLIGLILLWNRIKSSTFKLLWVIMFCIAVCLLNKIERIRNFTSESKTYLTGKSIAKDAFGYRLVIWRTIETNSLGKSLFFGYGTRETQNRINTTLNKETNWSFDWLEKQKIYNAHNQYIQFLLEIGLIGLFIFLYSIYKYIVVNRAKNLNIELIFIVLFCFQILSESMLLRFWGISFFMFFYCLFYQYNLKKIE